MRKHLLVPALGSLLAFGCAGSASSGGVGGNVADDEMPLSTYDSVFKGAPANDSLPVIDLKADAIAAKSTELLASQSPVQGPEPQRGVCTIFTTTALMEHLYIKAGMTNPELLRAVPAVGGEDAARRVRRLAKARTSRTTSRRCAQFGIVEESVDPYHGNEWTARRPGLQARRHRDAGAADQVLDAGRAADRRDERRRSTRCRTASSSTPTNIKAHITSEHTAVGVGIDFFYQAWNHGLSTLPIDRRTT